MHVGWGLSKHFLFVDVPGVNDSSHCTQVLMPATHEKEEEVSLKDIAVINKKTNVRTYILHNNTDN